MTLPGVVVERRDTIPQKTPPISVGRAFMAGLAEKGDVLKAVRCVSLGDFISKFGNRVSYGFLYDTVDTFFHEGGSEVWISRVVGPTPITATGNLLDQSGSALPADIAMIVNAKNPGDWANALNVSVTVIGTGFTLTVTHDTDASLVEISPTLADRDAAVEWATNQSKYINLSLGASNEDPRAQAISLTGGTDDRSNITDTQRYAAINRFGKELGPGQVAFPGATTTLIQGAVMDHAIANDRVAFLDGADTPTAVSLTFQVAAQRNTANRQRFAATFAPWDVIPGLTPNTTRVVSPVGRQMGAVSRLAAEGRTGNVAAAGNRGQARYVIGLSQPPWTNADREILNEGGVNVSIVKNNVVTTYGWRTMVDPLADPNWVDLGGTRIFTQIAAEADRIGEDYVFEEIDGEGRVFRRFEGDLKGMLLPFWQAGSLYGSKQGDAFVVDTGIAVNTPETIQARQINGDLGIKTSPHGEVVRIRVSKANLSEAI